MHAVDVNQLEAQVQKIQLEDGDILLVTIPEIKPFDGYKQLRRVQEHVTQLVREKMGIDAQVWVTWDTVKISALKKGDLGDIHQRLDGMQVKIDRLESEVLYGGK